MEIRVSFIVSLGGFGRIRLSDGTGGTGHGDSGTRGEKGSPIC